MNREAQFNKKVHRIIHCVLSVETKHCHTESQSIRSQMYSMERNFTQNRSRSKLSKQCKREHNIIYNKSIIFNYTLNIIPLDIA